jgi:diguanylate cyclase (GGDEF)-like protein
LPQLTIAASVSDAPTTLNSTRPLPFSSAEKLRYLSSNLRALLIWPVALGMFATAIWSGAFWIMENEKRAISQRAFANAAAQSRTYAEQLDRIIGQIDYIMLSLKYHWQKSAGDVSLEEQVKQGLVPAAAGLSITIVDRRGLPVTSTLALGRNEVSIRDRDYFKAHRQSDKGLLFSKPIDGLRTKRPVLILSRRLDDAQGAFDGLIVVAIEPAYLTSIADLTGLGKGDFIAARRADGVFLAARLIGVEPAAGPALKGEPALPAPAGLEKMPGERFVDGRVRYVGWHHARNYPMTGVVGLAEENLMAAYQARQRELQLIALAGSVLLLLVAGIGMGYSGFGVLRREYTREVEAAYRLATESAREGFYMLRPLYDGQRQIVDLLIEDCNERGALYRGLPREQLLGKRLSSTAPLLFQSHMLPACRQAMETGFYEDEVQLPAHESRQPQWLQRRLVRSGMGLAVTLRDITEAKLQQEAMNRLANADPVTMLPNRHWLMSHLPAALEQARMTGTLLAVMFVDLDDFKNVNDTLGHAAGDELLRAAAQRFRALVRPGDSIARLGGDEFTIILASASGEEDVLHVAGRLIAALRDPFLIGGGTRHTVQASVGISLFPQDGDDVPTLLKHADVAMYAAKTAGKGNYCLYRASLSEILLQRVTRQAELRHALEADEFELYYQPRVAVASGEMTSMEALVRWRHPQRGLIPPDDFIGLAEENGLIVPLGEQVIGKACAQLAQWRDAGLPVVPLSVNVSARQIDRASVSACLASCMARHDIHPSQIEVEITESATVAQEGMAGAELAAIRALGVRLYVDDFGTGYSSLSQLKRLDMDGLKVDQSFTSQIANGPEDLAFFTAILTMAHAIGMRVVAEGVETAQQLHLLQQLHCDEAQGYYVSPPVPAQELAVLLSRRFLFPPS